MPTDKMVIEILFQACRLLRQTGWNKFYMARDHRGDGVSPNSAEASCYCLCGALVKAWRTVDPDHEDFYFAYFEQQFATVLKENYGYDQTFTRWNDEVATCRDDVIALIQTVIARLRREQIAARAQRPPCSAQTGARRTG